MNYDSARHATQRANPTEIQGYVGLVVRCIPATHPMLGRLLAVHIYIISVVCSTGLLRVQPSDLTMMPLDLLPLPSSPPLGQDSQTPEAAKYHRLVPVLQQYIVVLISTVLSHKTCTNPPHSIAYPLPHSGRTYIPFCTSWDRFHRLISSAAGRMMSPYPIRFRRKLPSQCSCTPSNITLHPCSSRSTFSYMPRLTCKQHYRSLCITSFVCSPSFHNRYPGCIPKLKGSRLLALP